MIFIFSQVDLSTFLIQRACEKPTIANYLFWFVEIKDSFSYYNQFENNLGMHTLNVKIIVHQKTKL